jgi:O-antigen/teichoic acid export membrane protein
MSKSTNRLVQYFSAIPGFERAVEWIRLTGITGAAQFLVQGLGLLSGILVVRLLPTEEYALYTLGNTMLGVMVVLADSGISSGIMAQGGKVWKDKDKLGDVLVTGLDLRKKFAVGSLLIAAPILIYLLNYHGASWLMSVLIMLSLVPALIGSLSGAIFMVPLKLRQDIPPLQKNIIIESIGRLVLVLSLFLTPFTFIALLASGIPRLVMNIRLKSIAKDYVNWAAEINLQIRRDILKIVKRLMPGAIYYCVSGQISIWLISIFGTTTGVAQIGALGRIAIALTVISNLFGTLVYPRFARLPHQTGLLVKRFIQIQALLFLICGAVVAVVWLFSDEILWVLGDGYENLNFELVLSIIGSCLGLISGAVFKLTTHRNWAVHPGLSIPVSILGIISGAIIMDVSTLQGILLFNIFVVLVQFVLNTSYFAFEIIRHRNKEYIQSPEKE